MAQVHISYSLFNTNNNLLTYPNVSVQDKLGATATKWETNSALFSCLSPVVVAHPDWRFIADSHVGTVLTGFHVKKDDEELGKVFIGYKGRSTKICISNRRIGNELSRGETKYTQDPAVAEKLVRKFFYPKLLDERVASAENDLNGLIQSESWDKARAVNRVAGSFFAKATEFVESRIDEYILAYPQVAPMYEKWKEAKLDMQTVEDIKSLHGKGDYVLVILDGSEYIVRAGGEVKVYNNDTLPEELRAKIGMLKVVEPGQMISGVGCKSHATALLVVGVELKS